MLAGLIYFHDHPLGLPETKINTPTMSVHRESSGFLSKIRSDLNDLSVIERDSNTSALLDTVAAVNNSNSSVTVW